MAQTPPVSVRDLERLGAGLHRPECVVADPGGGVYVSDWRGGITRIGADGSQDTWLARGGAIELRPNGFALASDGSFLVANLGDAGGVWRLRRDGTLLPFATEVDGAALPPANFVAIDGRGRTWISVSTRHVPRHRAWRPGVADGFIVLVDAKGTRVVADGLHYTNEVRTDPSGEWLYAVETFGRRLTRWRIGGNGRLSGREAVASFEERGSFPDGFAFDGEGDIWVACLIGNRLLRLRGGGVETILEDVNPAFVEAAERAFAAGQLQPEHLGPIPEATVQQLTSVAFGPDERSVLLGSLHSSCVYRFRR